MEVVTVCLFVSNRGLRDSKGSPEPTERREPGYVPERSSLFLCGFAIDDGGRRTALAWCRRRRILSPLDAAKNG